MLSVTFLGAAGTVTGSRFLVESDGARVLVDCGLFQGLKVLRLRNREPLPFEPASIDAVLLTHAHLDHSGFLPVLVRDGFEGPIHCTAPTRDLVPILLADSGRIQEEDARYANRKGYSRHRPALPLYTERDAAAVEPALRTRAPGEPFTVGDLRVEFGVAGHILGAATIRISAGDRSVTFSGDLGRNETLLMPPPEPARASNLIVMESTYGDRRHPEADPLLLLADVARRTLARGGVLMIPSFAVGRAQEVLLALHRLMRDGAVRRVPVFLNSPMAIDVTELFHVHGGYHRVLLDEYAAAFAGIELVRSVEESKALNRRRGPIVIVAGAGMLTGGRILHHLRAFGGDRRNTIVLVGHQAAGTRGAALVAGAGQLKVHGSYVRIRAEVARIDGFSAHADQRELLDWLSASSPPPGRVFLVHGEPSAADCLRLGIRDELGIAAYVARDGERVALVPSEGHADGARAAPLAATNGEATEDVRDVSDS